MILMKKNQITDNAPDKAFLSAGFTRNPSVPFLFTPLAMARAITFKNCSYKFPVNRAKEKREHIGVILCNTCKLSNKYGDADGIPVKELQFVTLCLPYAYIYAAFE